MVDGDGSDRQPTSDQTPPADHEEVQRVVFTIFIMLVVLVSLLDAAAYYLLPLPETVREVLFISDSICAVILMITTIMRLIWSPRKRAFLVPWGVLELLGSVPGLPALRFLWLPRLWRTWRQLHRTTPEDVIRAARRRLAESTLLIFGAIMLVLVMTCSIAIVLVEAGAPNANIVTGSDAVWWAIVTAATVGYGDYYPVTNPGRIIGVLLIFGGMSLFAVLTSFVASAFLGRDRGAQRELAALREEIASMRRDQPQSRETSEQRDEPPGDAA